MKYIYISIVLFSVSLLQSCDNDSYRAFTETQVIIEKSDVSFTSEGGTGQILVDPKEGTITASADQPWCEVSVSGHTISVTVGANVSLSSRKSLITIRSNDKVNYVPVYQEPLKIILDDYTSIFLGNGGTISVGYKCDEQIASVESNQIWLEASVSDNKIVLMASKNPSFTDSRNATVKILAKNNSAVMHLDVIQWGFVTSHEVDANVESIKSFLNFKNNTTSSRYKITYFSPEINEYYKTLKSAYPIIQEMRIETPRGSYKLSVSVANVIGDKKTYYYWNATNGLTAVSGSKFRAVFTFSGNSYAGENPAYATDFNFTKMREIFATPKGFTIIPDKDNTFWFRSEDNPLYYFKVEPAEWI